MKKVVLSLSFALLSSFLVVTNASTIFGGNTTSDVKASENSVREQLATVLSNVAFEDGNEVTIYFSVSSDKGFELTKVDGSDSDLTSEVKNTLTKKTISIPSNLEGKYAVKVKFTDVKSL